MHTDLFNFYKPEAKNMYFFYLLQQKFHYTNIILCVRACRNEVFFINYLDLNYSVVGI